MKTRDHSHNGQDAKYDTTAHNGGKTLGDAKGRLGNLYSFAKFSAYLRSKGRRVSGSGRVKVVSVDAIAHDTLRGLAPVPSTVHERRQVVNFLVDLDKQGAIRLGKLGTREVVFIEGWLAIG